MPLCIAAIAGLAWAAGLPPIAALLLGASLAPADPVLASDVQVGPPKTGDEDEVRFALTSEAGLNDGFAFPFVNLAVALAAASATDEPWLWRWIGVDVLWEIGAGVAGGWLVGRLFGWLTFHVGEKARLASTGDGLIAIAATFVSYGVTEMVHCYRFLAVFVTAMTLRDSHRDHDFHAGIRRSVRVGRRTPPSVHDVVERPSRRTGCFLPATADDTDRIGKRTMFFATDPVVSVVGDAQVVERLGDGCVYRRNGAFRLSVPRYPRGPAADVLESEDVAFLLSALRTWHDNSVFVGAWWKTEIPAFERDLGEGRYLRVHKEVDGMIEATAHVRSVGRPVGRVASCPTCWEGDVVLGELTFNASMNVDEAYRGLGLVRAMHDLVEEMTGLPMAPHGRRRVQGGLTWMGEEFWRKRASVRRVPGWDDPVAAEREAVFAVAEQAVRLSEFDRTEPLCAVALARRSGGRVVVHVEPTDEGLPTMTAWCTDHRGRVETGVCGVVLPAEPPAGSEPVSPDEAEEIVRRAYEGAGIGARFDEMVSRAAARVDEFQSYERSVSERIAGIAVAPAM